MKARFRGRCSIEWHPIHSGDIIEKYGTGYAHPECIRRAQTAKALVARARGRGLCLGVWDCPKGSKVTFTRREFVRLGLEIGHFTEDEAAALRKHWSGILDNDLSD